MRQEIEDWLEPLGAETLFADGFDEAIIGLTEVDEGWRTCYDTGRIMELLVSEQGMTELEAMEYFDFNIAGAYVGPLTPIFIQCVL